jgi:hypothetical protein
MTKTDWTAEYSAEEVQARSRKWTREEILSSYVPVPESGCWLWLGPTDDNGYGRIRFEGRQMLVHRFFYAEHNGVLLPKMFVCHRCGTPTCVNPEHLWLGTSADNNHDMMDKGRNNFSRNKITPEIAFAIVKSDKPTQQLVAELGFSKATIDNVRCGKSWSRQTSKARSERGPRPLFFKHAKRTWINE